jgi:hypothetical protein
MYVQALWEFNWTTIFYYEMTDIVAFLLLCCSIILFPTTGECFMINGIVSGLLIVNELRQVIREGFFDYFSDINNYLDLTGHVLIIVSAVDLNLSPNKDEFYEDRKNTRILIIGLLLSGLRAVFSLHIFEPFRVQI